MSGGHMRSVETDVSDMRGRSVDFQAKVGTT